MLVLVVYTLYFCFNSKGPRFDPQARIFLPFIFCDSPMWSQKTWKRRHKKVRSPSGYFFAIYILWRSIIVTKTCKRRHKTYKNTTIIGAVQKLHFVMKFGTFLWHRKRARHKLLRCLQFCDDAKKFVILWYIMWQNRLSSCPILS